MAERLLFSAQIEKGGEAVYYSRKRMMDDHPVVLTDIWSCSKEGCNGWMRFEYSFLAAPECALCLAPMVRGVRELPVLLDSTYDRKAAIKKHTASL